MPTKNIVARGYVLIRDGKNPSAVVSKTEAVAMQRRFGGRIVNAAGHPFRYAQQRQLRVLTNPEALA